MQIGYLQRHSAKRLNYSTDEQRCAQVGLAFFPFSSFHREGDDDEEMEYTRTMI